LIADPAFRRAAAGIRAEIDAMPSAADVLAALTVLTRQVGATATAGAGSLP
jgi:hypothetical protein